MASSHSPTSTLNSQISPGQAPVKKPSAPPVRILSSQLSRTYSYVHPALLLGLCAARFDALVADPVQELFTDLPWLSLLQIFYVVLCLPPAGSTSAYESSPTNDAKATSRSSSGPATALRPGKPGHRRRQHGGKNLWSGVWAKLMVSTDVVAVDNAMSRVLTMIASPLSSP